MEAARSSPTVEKSNDGNTVTIFFEKNSVLSIALNKEKNKVTFKIDNGRREYEFIVKQEAKTENLTIYPMRLD